jgi:F0F1-type ATP synthase assembly protein I
MATAALLAQCLFVLIVFLVAGKTLLDQFVAVQVSCVAVFAGYAAVLTSKHVFGVRVVIKAVASPLFSAVTGIALFTKLALMPFLVIYFAVTGVANF